MTEQQLEILERYFISGVIVMKEPNGRYTAASFGEQCVAMDRVVDSLTGGESPKELKDILNKEYPLK